MLLKAKNIYQGHSCLQQVHNGQDKTPLPLQLNVIRDTCKSNSNIERIGVVYELKWYRRNRHDLN